MKYQVAQRQYNFDWSASLYREVDEPVGQVHLPTLITEAEILTAIAEIGLPIPGGAVVRHWDDQNYYVLAPGLERRYTLVPALEATEETKGN